MKICPVCSATVGDDATVCAVDGSPLQPGASANTLPARRLSGTWCMVCGARDADDGGGECVRCGNRFAVPRSIPPGAAGSRIAKMLVVRPHGEGDMVVTTDAGGQQLVVFGSSAAIELEAAALAAAGKPFPSVLEVGYAVELGRYARLTLAIDGAVPLLEVDLSFREGIDLVRRTLDAAAELEAHGFGWEPAPTDIYLRDGQVLVVRARGARRLAAGEALDAKRVLEALAGALLPVPFALATPDLIRLLLPRFNFSTVLSRSIVEARADVAVAERLAATRSGARVGAVCDPGLRRDHNDDATAVAEGAVSGEPFAVLVVCDGVSSSSHAGRAAAVAASVARDRLEPFVRAGPPTATDTPSAVRAAIEAAHEAVCASATDWGDGTPPGTTLVAAVVAGHRLTVGWVGDSRAYWVSARGAELLTSDHSWLNEVDLERYADLRGGDGFAARARADEVPRAPRWRRSRGGGRARRPRPHRSTGPGFSSSAPTACGTTSRPRRRSPTSSATPATTRTPSARAVPRLPGAGRRGRGQRLGRGVR